MMCCSAFVALLAQDSVQRAAQVRERIDAILARDEFGERHAGPGSWIAERVWEFLRWLGHLFGFESANVANVFVVGFYVLIGLVVATLLYVIVRGILRLRRAAAAPTSGAFVDEDEEALRARVLRLRHEARAAAARGEHALALRLSFWALVMGLSERGDLEYRDAWTNRELVQRGKPRADVRARLAPLVPELDAKSFGHVEATSDDCARLERLCDELLGTLPAELAR